MASCVAQRVDDLMSQGTSAQTIALITIGIVLLIAGGVNEAFTTRSAVIPPRLFKVSCRTG